MATLYVTDEHLESLQYSFGSVEIFSDNIPAAGTEDFFVKKDITHQFRPEEKEPLAIIPNIFSALAMAPWGILCLMVRL